MASIHTILVATDLSPFSLAAMEYADAMRLAFGARLHVLHVLEERRGGEDPARGTNDAEGRLRELRGVVGRSLAAASEAVCSVRSGDPAVEICRYARETGADVVLMTTHGRTGLRHMFLGGVAERVVRRSGVPVMTIKPPALAGNFLCEEDVERELHLC